MTNQVLAYIGPLQWFCLALLIVAALGCLWVYYSRMRENSCAADIAFESAILESIAVVPPSDKVSSVAEAAPPSEVAPVSTETSEAGLGGDVEGAIERLKRGGLVVAPEGFAEANGDPHGAVIIQMRNGTHALVAPWPQTEEYMSRALRRFDLLILAAAGGRAYTIAPLEKLIADEIVSSMWPPPSR